MVTSPPPAPDMSVADGLFLCRDPTFKGFSIYAKGADKQKDLICKRIRLQKDSIFKMILYAFARSHICTY